MVIIHAKEQEQEIFYQPRYKVFFHKKLQFIIDQEILKD